MSVSSDSPHKLITPIQTPLPSQNTSPKVNGISEASEDNSRSTVVSKPTVLEDFLILEKTNNTVSNIKLETEIESSSEIDNCKESVENIKSKDIEGSTEKKGVFAKVSLVSESNSFRECEQETSQNNLEDIEPLSLDLGDPTAALDSIQPAEDDFYNYEQLENSQEWVSTISTNIPKQDYSELCTAEDISNNLNSFDKDFVADEKRNLNLDFENSVEKPRLESQCVETLNVPNAKDVFELEIEDSKSINIEHSVFHGSIKGDHLSENEIENEFPDNNQVEEEADNDFYKLSENVKTKNNFLPSVPLPDLSSCLSEEFDDFKCDSTLETSPRTLQIEEFHDCSAENSEKKDETMFEDDDFGDFTNFTEQRFEKVDEIKIPDQDEDDDFGDFNDFESALEHPAVEHSQFDLKESISRIENKNVSS